MDYNELVKKRKQFNFEDLPAVKNNGKEITLKNPQNIEGGQYDEENELNPWSRWQGDLNAEILVIGQDWGGEECYREQQGIDSDEDVTNENLIELFKSIGITVRKPSEQYSKKIEQNLFFTNCILGIKEGSKTCAVDRWIEINAKEFLKPLIQEVLNPKIIITLGLPAFKSVNEIFKITEEKNYKLNMKSVLTKEYPYIQNDIKIFSFYHCGRLGVNNRSLEKQIDDWSILKKYV
ncbi:uracil-DNA glycosylase family protein [Clostridium butyricum]|uniref:Uracil-DNA glycosylase-like domain-containing protein n=1 Tax=Clostridium butyricum TaxID=1492 RepID=A0AAP9UEK2_CLOBU|nr:hypothetical protein [Clostridium butyricum]MBZ5746262.1 uracil-DNA glycosylase family protein [Clostridium butyricum]MCQ2017853.1 uracil-DNA glycosylase family protein [Clostridium butyricum]MCQ2021679.1 uracil-DNA glycosylase family protein [Clostridium butyricum]MDI9210072.1 uracil-DNA glycosylase family protein [Clostridium butyricum]NFB72171.1 hypothetical protein [Clostridium butyricum]